MILLKKCLIDRSSLYVIATSDMASNGSETDLYHNICEMTNILYPFEQACEQVDTNFRNYDMNLSKDTLTEIIKPVYQQIRHGLAFDWVMNYTMKLILDFLPSDAPYVVFKGTEPFINQFQDDVVFVDELNNIETALNKIFKWVVGEEELDIIKRIPTNTMNQKRLDILARSKYLVYLLELLVVSIGPAKKSHWHEQFIKMYYDHPHVYGDVIVVGGKYRAFIYGDIDNTGTKWHLLSNGIKMSDTYRVQRGEYVRAFPDEMTFFKFVDNSMLIDESYLPTISINGQPSINNVQFLEQGHTCTLNTPHQLTITYKFIQDPDHPKRLKLTAGKNCTIKDDIITLDQNGQATTEVTYTDTSVLFKITDSEKIYPPAIFTTKQNNAEFDWLT